MAIANDAGARGAHREARPGPSRAALWSWMLASGGAGLTWEILWQHHAEIALGVGAFGAAVTLAALMAGLGVGGLIAARFARSRFGSRPLRAYGVAEMLVGTGGLLVPAGLHLVARLDVWLYARLLVAADVVHAIGVGLVLVAPSAAMGATVPLLAPRAGPAGTTLSAIYASNLAGAVMGALGATFAALPLLGVARTSVVAAALNLGVGAWALAWDRSASRPMPEAAAPWPPPRALVLAFTSAFVVFALEVSWFRSMRAAYQVTTETFAVLIAAVLVALAAGGWLAPRVRARDPGALPFVLALAGLAILFVTPFVDQLDRITLGDSASPATPVRHLRDVLAIVFVPVTLLGIVFPWVLSEHGSTTSVGRLYAVNTLGAVSGSLLSGFLLLPRVGASATSWAAALALIAVAFVQSRGVRARAVVGAAGALGLYAAVLRHDGGARQRVQGFESNDFFDVAFVSEGPDSTVWVARERRSGRRALIIDGFQASGEGLGTEYMRWMGYLPAIATPRLQTALVICFGTGQTADALRSQGPDSLTVVDVNPAVFRASPLFDANHGVLRAPNVRHVVMDGRAFLRRHPDARFDAITLEPMPPNHVGSNHLYSAEFYALARSRLRDTGTLAQWLPLHLVAPAHVRAIVAAFVGTFPFARLWMDPSGTAILVGGVRPWSLRAPPAALPLTPSEIDSRLLLDGDDLRRLSAGEDPVTDDNQALAYGLARLSRSTGRGRSWSRRLAAENAAILAGFAAGKSAPR